MEAFFSMAAALWNGMAPTTWFLVLGLLFSLSFLKKVLF